MNHSIHSADRSTHLKIVVVALVAGIGIKTAASRAAFLFAAVSICDSLERSTSSHRKMARETGLEPAASAVTGRRSNQLSYSRGCRNHVLIRAEPRA